MRSDTPHILLVNPWIHDFAAYDFWAKPIGLLYLASILRIHGVSISYIDCLDRFHPLSKISNTDSDDGRGPYIKTTLSKPTGLNDIPRTYSRYGILPKWFLTELSSIPKPDLILVTSLMTYWYPGVFETIELIKKIYPDTPVILGGIYASLCHSHALTYSGADRIITGPSEAEILRIIAEHTGFSASLQFNADEIDSYPYPAFDLQRKIGYISLITSRGCPYSCTYCASKFLNPKCILRSPESVVEEISYWNKQYGVRNFSFYDDALLVTPENHAIPIFDRIIKGKQNFQFHTPNAIHIRQITEKIADLMFKAGFSTIRLGLESTLLEERNHIDQKVTFEEFEKAVRYLFSAGFNKKQIGAYLLVGLPGQSFESIKDSIKAVKGKGIIPVLAYYSPIPNTAMWEKAVASSRYDLEADPIFTNNAILPCQKETFSWEKISHLGKLCM